MRVCDDNRICRCKMECFVVGEVDFALCKKE